VNDDLRPHRKKFQRHRRRHHHHSVTLLFVMLYMLYRCHRHRLAVVNGLILAECERFGAVIGVVNWANLLFGVTKG
jgi:hypothetical protein